MVPVAIHDISGEVENTDRHWLHLVMYRSTINGAATSPCLSLGCSKQMGNIKMKILSMYLYKIFPAILPPIKVFLIHFISLEIEMVN